MQSFAKNTDFTFQATTGVSGGAVSAAILASYPDGQEQQAADRMVLFW